VRATVLRWIFSKRALPRGAKSLNEVKPERVVDSPPEAMVRMNRLAQEFENQVAEQHADPQSKLTHHIFGEIDPLRAIDFLAIHIEHHHRQIEAAVSLNDD